MHPILASRGRLALYLAAWGVGGILLAVLLRVAQGSGWLEASALAVPLAFLHAFFCLGAWFVCRALPLRATSVTRLAPTLLLSAVLSAALWVAAGRGWARALAAAPLPDLSGAIDHYRRAAPTLFVVGVLLFLLSAAVDYLMIAFEASREAERSALELQVLAREAELRALRAQIDPHFLFNSLNSISALTASDPTAARRMCLLLADLLRKSLKLGAEERIPLSQELAIVDSFLAVEQVRFGQRLRADKHIEPAASDCLLPPLLLQPLVENAVNHGIAGLVDGGTVRIEARERAGLLEITIENPCEPERPRSRGAGLGLANVRSRLAALDPREARIEIRNSPSSFRVALTLPARRSDPG